MNINLAFLEALRKGKQVVLATVVRSSGSTPQKAGSSALIGEDGLLTGTVGGGLLEAEVLEIASHLLISGESDIYFFNLDTKQGEEGAICGGQAEVLIENGNPGMLAVLEEAEQTLSGQAEGFMLTLVSKKTERGRHTGKFWVPQADHLLRPRGISFELWEHIKPALKQKHIPAFRELQPSPAYKGDAAHIFIQSWKTPTRLVIAGAGHVGKALARLTARLDFHVTVVDDRAEYANREQIPEAHRIIVRNMAEAMQDLQEEKDTYFVVVTRGHQLDAEALRPCIGQGPAYVGMIGSQHKVAQIKKKFLENAWASEADWSRVHTPIGLPIGSQTVEEIALSIAAQLVQVRNTKRSKDAG